MTEVYKTHSFIN